MQPKTTQSTNPSSSLDLLRQFVGKKATAIVRYSWWEKEEVSTECNIPREQSFSFTSGPLAVVFEDGSVLGVASDPGINSVIVWLDRAAGQADISQTLSEDAELFPINASDETYSEPFWNKFAERTLSGFSILKSKEMNASEAGLPSELGLCFHFGSDERFIASHGLHNGSDDFSVIADSQFDPIARGKIEELPLL
ncbi:hypothetical protein [Rhodoferax antarcticus]|uniref:Uncharacterized protein n=1 Tax=Rhodoferax antarcticus ANT.BR TaxID=1111071 RepID=A0A1Q8YJF7_9BURK|nr:hypothetical protein [Rhodoferax antarcticus]APW47599.1 hypothetical protein RA876_15975 [Rhodoferax antarcticus]OLP08087.1 hypothetical protein BLL52_0375 [Rhodoferax antarcticus ANT.BR]